LGKQNIFKPTFGIESLRQDINDNGVEIVNFATSKIHVVVSTMFPHQNTHKCIWTSSDAKTHKKIDHILIDRRWHSRSFRRTECDIGHNLVVVRVREILTVNKPEAQKFDVGRFREAK